MIELVLVIVAVCAFGLIRAIVVGGRNYDRKDDGDEKK